MGRAGAYEALPSNPRTEGLLAVAGCAVLSDAVAYGGLDGKRRSIRRKGRGIPEDNGEG